MKVCDGNTSKCLLVGVSVAGIVVSVAFIIERLGALQ